MTRRRRKNMVAARHTNRDMNDHTFKLRRAVMGIIYEARDLVAEEVGRDALRDVFPRLDIRITDCSDPRVLGTARMGDRKIWIPASTVIDNGINDLRITVFHEILHAVWAVRHDKKCPLMSPTHVTMPKRKAEKLFLKHARKFINADSRAA